MEVGVKVMTENLLTGLHMHTCSAYMTFVALDSERRSVAVPAVIPETAEEMRRFEQAGERRAYRLATRARYKGEV
jgi:acyl-CoA hydrolase